MTWEAAVAGLVVAVVLYTLARNLAPPDVALPAAAVGIVYVALVSGRLLPDRRAPRAELADPASTPWR